MKRSLVLKTLSNLRKRRHKVKGLHEEKHAAQAALTRGIATGRQKGSFFGGGKKKREKNFAMSGSREARRGTS